MIRFENVLKQYKNKIALQISSLEIPPGNICGIVGNNGAGKTTMFSLLLDLIKADKGVIHSDDVIVSESEHWKSYTGSYINDSFLLEFLTPEEYFEFIADLYGWNKTTLKPFLDQFTDLFNNEILGGGKYIRDLSKGNQKKVGIVGALIGDPQVIILDEPFANLDPSTQNRLKQLILEMKNDQRTILISSHDLNHVHEVSDRIIVLETGELVMDIPKDENSFDKLKTHFQV